MSEDIAEATVAQTALGRRNGSANMKVALPQLPEDIFLLILKNMDAWDMVRCRKVSRAWRCVFSKHDYLREMLKKYPLTREIQELQNKDPSGRSINWQELLDKIASRYYHLTHGKARSVTKYKLAASEQFSHWYPVSQWDYHESQPTGRLYYENATHISRLGSKAYLFRPTFWSYDDGLLVLAPRERSGTTSLVILDMESKETFPIPFDTKGKVLRQLRLKDRTLIIEWAEKDPYHDLNDSEKVHRHFATCFDVKTLVKWSNGSSDSEPTSWTVSFRSEWKIHFLGLPLNHRDRFFSTHTATHYAVYFWQPNRSMYTGDEEMPIESLYVWNISSSSSYQPSTDPAGERRPQDDACGPRIVSRFPFHALDFLGVRQHSDITLMSLRLDSPSKTITLRENVCVAGQGYFDPAERLWCAKTTSFPFAGYGPHLSRKWDGNLPPYRGHCSMESANVKESEKWFLPIMDVVDTDAEDRERVRISLVETCFTGLMMENRVVVRVKVDGVIGRESAWVVLGDQLVEQVAGMGRIAGDERWLVGQNSSMEVVVLKF